ncbi:MAG: aldo/keto reductase [Pseudomonadota bacterium]
MHDLSIPPLTYGTMQWGAGATLQDAAAMYDACRTRGLTHFDTAYLYTEGQAERMLGQLCGSHRDEVTIATKVAYDGGASPQSIHAQFDISLQRLNTDYVDILYLHRWNDDPLEAQFETLAALQQSGRIRHIGVSNFAAWQVMKAQTICARLDTRIDVIQPMYSLVKRQAEVELFPMAADQGITLVPYSPLGGGLLTGKYASGGTGRLTNDSRYKARYDVAWMHDGAAGLARLAADWGVHPATLAVGWAMGAGRHPIISAKTMDQLHPSLAALDQGLTAEHRGIITALSQKPAPATDRIEEE